MSRSPNPNTNSWLPLWNSSATATPPAETRNPSSHSTPAGSRPQSPSKEPSDSTDSKPSTEQANSKRKLSSTKPLNSKSSSTSLGSMAAGNWLKWSSRTRDNQLSDENEEHAPEDEQVPGDEERGNNDEQDDDDNDYAADDNGDEIDEQYSKGRKKGGPSSWTFWNSDSNETTQPKEQRTIISNTIVNSTPSIPSLQDTTNNGNNKHKKVDKANDDESSPPPEGGQDDAVLYKPHDKTAQFNQINTHKNENLRENVIVPDWNSCLPAQSSSSLNSSLASSIFGNSSTSNHNNAQESKMDLKNWRTFINQLSSKLGFSSQSLTSVVASNEDEPDSKEKVEKEFNLLYEKTYRLYGRSLQKLPPHKRACLPNYNKFYTNKDEEETYKFDQQTQFEDDIDDPNSISISNDPMGNLLINHKTRSTKHHNSDVVSYKSGPLKRIKKILIIGVHGFFPTKMIRPIIGSPKGTSLKFANEAEKGIIRYCIENNLINEDEANSISIQKIALEKEGKIFDRVDFFTDILQKWQKELNESDFIFIAAHSQGCVVSIILLAKLISMGILKDPIRKRIGILGMAGINNGPFYGSDKSFLMKAYSAIEHDSLTELFEFTKFTSQQSLVYKQSIEVIVNANVKVCFIGSINDQLVPLYSALASHIYHPNVYRACYIDHSSQTPLFIQKLVSLCCHLQNIGFFDNNVLKELSTSLTGSITGGGHSKIYNDGKVYDLGIKFVLDTDDIVIPSKPLAGKPNSQNVDPNEGTSNGHIDGSIATNKLVTSGIGTYGSTQEFGEMDVSSIPVTNRVYIKEYNVGKIGTNPFILPWCLRGLLFNIEKNWPNNSKLLAVESAKDLGRNGYDEIKELYDLFDAWRPDSKVLRELKFRLNGMRASKL